MKIGYPYINWTIGCKGDRKRDGSSARISKDRFKQFIVPVDRVPTRYHDT
jgi:hypothetical protein